VSKREKKTLCVRLENGEKEKYIVGTERAQEGKGGRHHRTSRLAGKKGRLSKRGKKNEWLRNTNTRVHGEQAGDIGGKGVTSGISMGHEVVKVCWKGHNIPLPKKDYLSTRGFAAQQAWSQSSGLTLS